MKYFIVEGILKTQNPIDENTMKEHMDYSKGAMDEGLIYPKILLSYLEEFLVLGSQVGQIYEEIKEFRFAKGKVCPHCNSESISRNGKYNGRQRYICN